MRLFEYYWNTGGVIPLQQREYQVWNFPDSYPLDLQRPRWKSVTDQDTFSVYFGPAVVIDQLIKNFTGDQSLDIFVEYLLAKET